MKEHESVHVALDERSVTPSTRTTHSVVGMEVDRARVSPGERVRFRLTWANPLSQASDLTIRCALPEGLRFLSAELPDGVKLVPPTGVVEGRDAAHPATLAFLATAASGGAGGSAEVLAEVGAVRGSGPLQALVALEIGGEVIGSAHSVPIRVDVPTVALTLDVSSQHAAPGDVLLYTLGWFADGGPTGPGRLQFQLPACARLVQATGGGRLSEVGGRVEWELGTLEADQMGSVMATVRIDTVLPPGENWLEARASVDARGLLTPADSGAVSTRVHAKPQLTATLRAGRGRAVPGELVPVVMCVTNTGHARADGIRVVVPAIEGAVNESASAPATGPMELVCQGMDVGETTTLEWSLRLSSSFPRGTTILRPLAHMHSAGAEPTPVRGGELAVEAQPQLAVSLALEAVDARPGGTLVYVATCENLGPAEAAQVAIGIPIPEHCTALPELTSGTPDAIRRQLVVRVGSLAPGARAEVRLGVRLDEIFPDGQTEVAARASAAAHELPLVHSDPVVACVVARPDLELLIDVPLAEASPGERLTWTLTCRNHGNAPALGVVATARVPHGVVITQAGGATMVDEVARELSWSLGDVAPQREATARCIARLDAIFPVGETDVVLRGRLSWDGGGAPGQAAPVRVTAQPKLEVELASRATSARPGAEVRYQITCRNTGNAACPEIALDLEGEVEVLTALADRLLSGLEPGKSARRELLCRLPSTFVAGETMHTLTARASAGGGAETWHGLSQSAAVRVFAAPDLQLTAGVDTEEAAPGDALACSLELVNHGDAAATQGELTLLVPAEAQVVSVTGDGAFDTLQGRVRWPIGRVDVDQPIAVGVVLELNDCFPAGATRLALVFDANAAEPHTGTRRVAEVMVRAAPRLGVSAIASPPRVQPGDAIRVRLQTSNSGDAVAAGAVLCVRLPERVSLQSGGHWDPGARLVTWDLEPLALGAEQSRELVLTADASFPAGATSLLFGANLSCKRSTAECSAGPVVVDAAPRFELEIGVDRSAVSPGEPVMYSIRWHNSGNAPTRGLVVCNALPPRTSFVSASAGGRFDPMRHAVVWELGPASVGAGGEVRLTARLDDVFPRGTTELANVATAGASELDVIFESDEHTLLVEAMPALVAQLTSDASTAKPGDQLTFTARVDAGGLAEATDVLLCVRLPEPLQVVSASGNASYPADGSVAWELGHMPPGQHATVHLTAAMPAVVEAGLTELVVHAQAKSAELPFEAAAPFHVTVDAAPAIECFVAVPDLALEPGDVVVAQLRVVNNGLAGAAKVEAVLDLPTGLASAGGADALRCAAERLNGGGDALTREVELEVLPEFGPGETRVPLTLWCRSDEGPGQSAATSLRVVATPSVSWDIAGPPAHLVPGVEARWSALVRNTGPVPLHDLVVTLDLADGIELLPPVGQLADAAPMAQASWSVSSLAPSETHAIEAVAVVRPNFAPGETVVTQRFELAARELPEPIVRTLQATVMAERAAQILWEAPPTTTPGARVDTLVHVINRGTAPLVAAQLEIECPPRTCLESGSLHSQVPHLVPGDVWTREVRLVCDPVFPSGLTGLPLCAVLTAPDGFEAMAPHAAIQVSAAADLLLQAQVEPALAEPGAVVQWTLTLTNSGNAAATACVFDLPPEGCQVTGVLADGQLNEETGMLSWNLDDVRPGDAPVVLGWEGRLATALPEGRAVLLNAPSLDAGSASGQCMPAELHVDASSSLGAALTVTPPRVESGQEVAITLEIANADIVAAEGLAISILLPNGLLSDERCVWQIGSLAAGESHVRTLIARADDGLPAGITPLTVCAVVDHGDVRVTREARTELRLVPTLEVHLQAPSAGLAASPGELLEYELRVSVTHGAPARNLRLEVPLPAEAALEWADHDGAAEQSPDGLVLVWQFDEVPVGEARTTRCGIRLPLAEHAGVTSLSLQARATADCAEPVTSQPAQTEVVAQSEITLDLTCSVPVVAPGGRALLTCTVANQGDAPAHGVDLRLGVPKGLAALGALEHRIVRLAPGATERFELELCASPDAPEGVTAHALMATCEAPGHSEVAHAALQVSALPRLSVVAAVSNEKVQPGERFTVTLSARNRGHAAARNVVVKDAVPAHVEVVGVSTGGAYDPATRTLVWSLGSLPLGPDAVELIWEGRAMTGAPAGRHELFDAPTVEAHGVDTVRAQEPARIELSCAPRFAAQLAIEPIVPTDGPLTTTAPIRLAVQIENTGNATGSPQVELSWVGLPAELVSAEGGRRVERGVFWACSGLAPGDSEQRQAVIHVEGVLSAGEHTLSAELRFEAEGLDAATVCASQPVWALPAVTCAVEVSDDAPQPGDEVEITLDYAIGTSVHATDLRLILPLPDHLHVVSLDEGASVDGNVVIWTPGRFAAQDVGSMRAVLRVGDSAVNGDELQLVPQMSARGLESCFGAAASMRVRALPRLSFDVTVDNGVARPGEALVYTLRVASTGHATARDVVVRNPVPIDCTPISVGNQGQFDEVLDALVWRMGDLDTGEVRDLSWTARLDGGFSAGETEFVNLAVAEYFEGEVLESGEVCTRVVAGPELALELSMDVTHMTTSQPATLRAVVSNVGDATASETRLALRLPAALEAVEAELALGRMAPGASFERTFAVRAAAVLPAGAHDINIEVVATTEGAQVTESVALTVHALPELALSCRMDVETGRPGDVLAGELQWSNRGGAAADEVVLLLPIPQGTTLARANPEPVAIEAGEARWQLGRLAAQHDGGLSFALAVDLQQAMGERRLRVAPSLFYGEDRVMADPTAVTLKASPRLVARVSSDRAAAAPGDEVAYTFHAVNRGDATAETLRFVLALPPAVTLVRATGGPSSFDVATRSVSLDRAVLDVGEEATFDVVVRTDAVYPAGDTELKVRGRFDCAHIDAVWCEPILTRVRASAEPLLALVCNAESAAPGDVIELTVRAENTGCADLPNAALAVTLPVGSEPLEGRGSQLADDGRTLVWPAGTLRAQSVHELPLSFRLAPWFTAGTSEVNCRAELKVTGGAVQADSEATLWVHATPALALILEAGVQEARPGDTVPLSLSMSGGGNAPAENLEIMVCLEGQGAFGLEALDDDMTGDAATLRWVVPLLAPGRVLERTVPVLLAAEFPAGISTVTARLAVEAGNAPHVPEARTTVRVVAAPQPVLSATYHTERDDAALQPGDTVHWLLRWANTGDAVARAARLLVRPAPLTCVDGSSGPVEHALGDLAVGSEGELSVAVTIAEHVPAGTTPVSPELLMLCADTAALTAEVPVLVVEARSELVVSVTNEMSVAMAEVATRVSVSSAEGDGEGAESAVRRMPVGANLKFTLTIENRGRANADDAVIRHELPPGSSFIKASDDGVYEATGHRVVWRLGTVPAGSKEHVRTTVVRFGG